MSHIGRRRSKSPSRSRSRSRSHERLHRSGGDLESDRLARYWRVRSTYVGRINEHFVFELLAGSDTGQFRMYVIKQTSDVEHIDLEAYLFALEGALRDELLHLWGHHGGINFRLTVYAEYYKPISDDNESVEKTLVSPRYSVMTLADVNDYIAAAMANLIEQHDKLTEMGSGWVLVNISSVNRLKIDFLSTSNSNVSGSGIIYAKHGIIYGRQHIPLPEWVKNKQAVINVLNEDNRCFRYAMETAWHFKHGSISANWDRPSKYKTDHFNYGDLVFPIHITDIAKFENLNKDQRINIKILFANEKKYDLSVVYCSSQVEDADHPAWHINILIFTQIYHGEQIDFHYAFIKSLKRLMRAESHSMIWPCERCLTRFSSEVLRNKHMNDYCKFLKTPKRGEMPVANKKWKYFKNFQHTQYKPFVIYADFEAFNAAIEHKEEESKTESNRMTKQIASGYCFYVSCLQKPEFNQLEMWTTEATDLVDGDTEVANAFITAIQKTEERINGLIQSHFKFPFNDSNFNKNEWRAQKDCCICNMHMDKAQCPMWESEPSLQLSDFDDDEEKFTAYKARCLSHYPTEFDEANWEKAIERDIAWYPHLKENNYRGACHRACKQNIMRYGKVPVLFHNLTGYDAHLIISHLKKEDFAWDEKKMHKKFTAIPEAGDKFKTFTIGDLQFIDTARFIGNSLDAIVKDNSDSPFPIFNTEMTKLGFPEEVKKLARKGVFPYEWFDHPNKLLWPILPDRNLTYDDQWLNPTTGTVDIIKRGIWYNHLKDCEISDEDWERAELLWKSANCRNFKDYHDLYLLTDVLLLADCFNNFRTVCMTEDHLEPFHYVSLPSYVSDACLWRSPYKLDQVGDKIAPFQLELITDNVVYEFMEGAIRGGVSMTPGRYAKANHKFLPPEQYDNTVPDSFIQYWDANGLYSWAMTQSIPTGNFKWMDGTNHLKFLQDHIDHPPFAKHGFMYEVDCEFPAECHDYLKDFPPAPEQRNVDTWMCSPFYNELLKAYGQRHDAITQKLLCTLLPHKKYRLHYLNVKLYTQLGMKITKVHRILQFDQSRWLSNYVNYNADKRKLATSNLAKDYFKLCNNAAYGRFIMDVHKFSNVRAVFDTDSNNKQRWHPLMTDWHKINPNLTLCYTKNSVISKNSPIAVGAVILEHAKWLIYNFYYNVLKKIWNVSVKLILTDTDSLVVQIFTSDVMNDIKNAGMLKEFEFSEWPRNDSFHGATYHAVDCKCDDEPSPCQKKLIGKFKDEDVVKTKGKYLTEVYACRSKMYICLYPDGENKSRAKGIKTTVRNTLREKEFKRCFGKNPIEKAFMYSLQSKDNNIYLTRNAKALLSPLDSKVYMVDMFTSYPYGYYKIPPDPPLTGIELNPGPEYIKIKASKRYRNHTDQEHCQYRSKWSKRKAANYKGVTFHKSTRKYRARIQIPHTTLVSKRLSLGLFSTPEEAYEAYCLAAVRHFGTFAKLQ